MVGLISYGTYVPYHWLRIEEIARTWGADATRIASSLGVSEKAVAGFDEDAVTLGFEAASQALLESRIHPKDIGALFVGSESHPYAVNPTSTIIGDLLDIGNHYFSSDLEFACKAATTGLVVTTSLLQTGKINYGLVIGADCAQAKPHDVLEYTASSASVALIVGDKKSEIVAEIVDYCSFSSDTPDFWRRDGASFPSHGGRFTGEPAYFTHVLGAGRQLLKKTGLQPSDFAHCVFHMPNAKFPRDVAKRLGFSPKQLQHSLTVEQIGNPYTASALLGLANVLDHAKPHEKIFFVSYGSGAGSDALMFQTTDRLPAFQKRRVTLDEYIRRNKHEISYAEYLKMRKYI